MTENTQYKSCQVCSHRRGTLVYVVPDPYWGYGHYPKLCCDTCDPSFKSGPNIVFYKSHKYEPERDDYHLGFTSELPIDWMWAINDFGKTRCYDCRELIKTEKRGHGYVYETPEDRWPHESRQVYYCQPCFRLRKGVGRVNLNQITPEREKSLRRKRWSHRESVKRFK